MAFNHAKFIKSNTEALTALLDLIPLPVYIKDFNGQYLACNRAFEATSGLTAANIVGKNAYEIWPAQQADIFEAKDKALYANPEVQEFESGVTTPSGTRHIMQFHKKLYYDPSGSAAGYICALFDVTEKRQLEKKLITQALTDELTGLANRREGMYRLEQTLSESKRKRTAMCVALIDIDYFKKVNDTHGHATGDAVLMTIAKVLKKNLREYDICARFGGEEFMVCMADTPIEQAQEILERMRAICQASYTKNAHGDLINATVSIGVAALSANCKTAQALLEASDKALYEAKAGGRNQVRTS